MSDSKSTSPPSGQFSADGAALEKLVDIMAKLRAPDGCPWDKEQDLQSLRPYLIEEAYEVLEALDEDDPEEHRKELGDLLLQIVFQAQIRREQGEFAFADVAEAISEKLIRRHPHVFGDATAEDAAQVESNWAKIKAEERRESGITHPSAIDGIPRALPALIRAERLGDKASTTGFDWPTIAEVRQKVDEELGELDSALTARNQEHIQEELGDLLFSLAQLARKANIHPEDALRASSNKFERRFRAMEELAREQNLSLENLDDEQLDQLWRQVKNQEDGAPAKADRD